MSFTFAWDSCPHGQSDKMSERLQISLCPPCHLNACSIRLSSSNAWILALETCLSLSRRSRSSHRQLSNLQKWRPYSPPMVLVWVNDPPLMFTVSASNMILLSTHICPPFFPQGIPTSQRLSPSYTSCASPYLTKNAKKLPAT